jgi:hypothetical protein
VEVTVAFAEGRVDRGMDAVTPELATGRMRIALLLTFSGRVGFARSSSTVFVVAVLFTSLACLSSPEPNEPDRTKNCGRVCEPYALLGLIDSPQEGQNRALSHS